MRGYRRVLATADFRRLWLGTTVSALGDGMTFVALTWLVLSGPNGTARLGLLGTCYTAPVLLGGLLVGPLLDRFDKRAVLAVDSVVRAATVALIPLADLTGDVPSWLPFAVAAVYGLLKMVPLAGFPAAIPHLVEAADLDAANALESLGYSAATVVGPAAAGLLLTRFGPADLLLLDSLSFVAFAVAALAVRRPLRATPPPPVAMAEGGGQPGERDQRRGLLATLARDPVIAGTTVAFMAFNVASGMLLVTVPWLAKHHLAGGAAVLGGLLSAMAIGEVVGAAWAGRRQPRRHPVRAIGLAQVAAATAFLLLLASPRQALVATGLLGVGLLSAPMTVWAQSLRMRRIPAALHGRAFAALRTLMQATPPLGAALVTPLLAHGRFAVAAVAMAALAGLPAVPLVLRAVTPPPVPDHRPVVAGGGVEAATEPT